MLPAIVSESIILKKATIEEMGGKNSSINMRKKKHVAILILIFTARKRILRRLCFYRCLSVHRGGVVAWGGGMHGCQGVCMVAGGHVWLLGGLHGCWGCA